MAGKQGERIAVVEAECQRLREENQTIMVAIIQLQEGFHLCRAAINEVAAGKVDRVAMDGVVAAVHQLDANLHVLRTSLTGNTDRAVMLVPRARIHGENG